MFSLIKQGLRCQLRQKQWVLFNAIFPIFLMCLLGAMLSSGMSSDIDISDIKVCYFENEENKETIQSLKDNIFNEDITISNVDTLENGKERVEKENEILIYPVEDRIEVFYSDSTITSGAVVLSYLKSFSDINATVTEMYKIDQDKATEILRDEESFNDEVNVQLIKEEDAPNSYQYYGVVELTMMMFYVTLFPLSLIGHDRRHMIKERISISGVSDYKYFFSRICSSLILSIIILLPGFLFSIFVMKSKWGEYPIITFMYVIAMSFMMVTLGTVVGYAIKQRDKAAMFLQGLIIPVISFLGGSFVKLPQEADGIFNIITNISPLRWINKGIFQVAYYGEYEYLNVSLWISIIGTALLLVGLYIVIRKEKNKS